MDASLCAAAGVEGTVWEYWWNKKGGDLSLCEDDDERSRLQYYLGADTVYGSYPVSRVLYDCPMNFCSFRDVELADGTTKLGLILQCAYGLPAGANNLQFDATENAHPNGNRWNGSNRWKAPNIRQWLNTSGRGWYVTSQEYDEPPKAYVDWLGFLDCF